MANRSSYSFSSFEDSEYEDSFLYDDFVENEILGVEFEDDMEIISETEETAETEETVETGDATTQTRSFSDVWKFFTRKEEIKENQDGSEQVEKFILCNIGQCHLSGKNSTTTLERHLKAKHRSAYMDCMNRETMH